MECPRAAEGNASNASQAAAPSQNQTLPRTPNLKMDTPTGAREANTPSPHIVILNHTWLRTDPLPGRFQSGGTGRFRGKVQRLHNYGREGKRTTRHISLVAGGCLWRIDLYVQLVSEVGYMDHAWPLYPHRRHTLHILCSVCPGS